MMALAVMDNLGRVRGDRPSTFQSPEFFEDVMRNSPQPNDEGIARETVERYNQNQRRKWKAIKRDAPDFASKAPKIHPSSEKGL